MAWGNAAASSEAIFLVNTMYSCLCVLELTTTGAASADSLPAPGATGAVGVSGATGAVGGSGATGAAGVSGAAGCSPAAASLGAVGSDLTAEGGAAGGAVGGAAGGAAGAGALGATMVSGAAENGAAWRRFKSRCSDNTWLHRSRGFRCARRNRKRL